MNVDPIRDFKQFTALQNKLSEDKKFRELLLLLVMYNTNLRVGDALLLKWGDMLRKDCDKPVWRFIVSEKKTKHKKKIPMTDQMENALMSFWLKYKPNRQEYIFRSYSNRIRGRNQPWSRSYVWKFLKEYAKKVGIVKDNVGAHTPRKSWAYHARKNGMDIYDIMRILGHRDVRVTEIYCGIDEDYIRKAYKTVSELNKEADELINYGDLPGKLTRNTPSYMMRRKRK